MAGACGKRKGPDNDLYLCGRDIGGRTPARRALLPGRDGSALASVKVYWPEEAVRQAQGGAIAKDQREKEAFLAADWLSAELKEVAPAQAVALTLGTNGRSSHSRSPARCRAAGSRRSRSPGTMPTVTLRPVMP